MIITAYNDFELLEYLLKYYNKYYDCWVHIDKKSVIPPSFIKSISELGNIKIYRKYKINWGSWNHVLAVIYLLKQARKSGNYGYYHILPANAFPTKNFIKVNKFFENNSKNYMEIANVVGEKHLEERQVYYWNLRLFNWRGKFGKKIQNKLVGLQKKLGIRRKIRFKFKGYFYCHLTEVFVDYVIQRLTKDKDFIKQLKSTWVPEEFFFQNLIVGSEFETTIENNSLIYDDWVSGRGRPACLETKDLDEIFSDESFWARKIRDFSLAKEIINNIDI